MRMLKKFMLAAAVVGAIGSLGFAKEAKAEEVTLTVTTTGRAATTTVTGYEGDEDKLTVKWYLDDVTIGTSKVGEEVVFIDRVNNSKYIESFSKKTKLQNMTVYAEVYSGTTRKGKKTAAEDLAFSTPVDYLNKLYITSTGDHCSATFFIDSNGESLVSGSEKYAYAYDSDAVSITPSPDPGYNFESWNDISTEVPLEIVVSGPQEIKAILSSDYCDVELLVDGKYSTTIDYGKKESATLRWTVTDLSHTIDHTSKVDVYVDDKYLDSTSTGATSGSCTYKPGSAGTYKVYICGYDTEGKYWESNEVTVIAKASSVKISLSDYTDYITIGNTLQFKATIPAGVGSSSSNIKWYASSGTDYFDGYETSGTYSSTSSWTQTVKIKTKGSLDAGKTADIMLKCSIDGTDATFNDTTDTEKKLTVYSKASCGYNSGDRSISFTVPRKINTGTSSSSSSSSSTTGTTLSNVRGVRIEVFMDGTSLGSTNDKTKTLLSESDMSVTSGTVSTSVVESIIISLNNNKKITREGDLTFRLYPCNDSGSYNSNIYTETSAHVYKVVIRVGSGAGATAGGGTAKAYALPLALVSSADKLVATSTTTTATKEYVIYALAGQTIDLADYTDTKSLNFTTLTNGVNDVAATKRILVSTDSSRNIYTGTTGSSSSGSEAADRNGLDKVPKTGQSNVFVYVMAVIVCAAVGAGLYGYNKKSKRNI